jgi:hypothetical protein
MTEEFRRIIDIILNPSTVFVKKGTRVVIVKEPHQL